MPKTDHPGLHTPVISHQLGWLKGVQFAGNFLAQELGYLEAEGVAVHFIPGGLETNYRALVDSGRVTVSESTPLALVDGAVQGQNLVAFAAVMQRDPGAFFSLPERPIASLQDMAGKTIAAPDSVRKLTGLLLRGAGVAVEAVNFTSVAAGPDMLMAGEVDGFYAQAPGAAPALQASGLAPHILYMADLGAPGYAQALIVRRDTLEAEHDRLVGYTRALIKGWRHFLDHPESSVELIVREWADPGVRLQNQLVQAEAMRAFILAGDALTEELLWIDPERFRQALEFARAAGAVPQSLSIDAGQLVTQSVIRAAAGRP